MRILIKVEMLTIFIKSSKMRILIKVEMLTIFIKSSY